MIYEEFGDNGKVLPEPEALQLAEHEHIERSDAEKYRWAQACTILKWRDADIEKHPENWHGQ